MHYYLRIFDGLGYIVIYFHCDSELRFVAVWIRQIAMLTLRAVHENSFQRSNVWSVLFT